MLRSLLLYFPRLRLPQLTVTPVVSLPLQNVGVLLARELSNAHRMWSLRKGGDVEEWLFLLWQTMVLDDNAFLQEVGFALGLLCVLVVGYWRRGGVRGGGGLVDPGMSLLGENDNTRCALSPSGAAGSSGTTGTQNPHDNVSAINSWGHLVPQPCRAPTYRAVATLASRDWFLLHGQLQEMLLWTQVLCAPRLLILLTL